MRQDCQKTFMKNRVVLVSFALCLLLQNLGSPQSAQAAQSCKQVRAEVLRLEKAVAVEQAYFASYEGQIIKGKLKLEFEKSNKNRYLQKLGKIQYNNESCFTKSQYDQILQAHNWTAPFTIVLRGGNTASGKDCKNNPTSRKGIDLGKYEPKGTKPEVVCDVPTYLLVDMRNNLYGKSIYLY
jgi:hypothetical protein